MKETQPDASAEAAGQLQTFDAQTLAAVARGEIDLNALAREELAARGLNHRAKWVGFAEAERIRCERIARDIEAMQWQRTVELVAEAILEDEA